MVQKQAAPTGATYDGQVTMPDLDDILSQDTSSEQDMLEIFLQTNNNPYVLVGDTIISHTRTGQRLPATFSGVPFISNRRWRDRTNLSLYTEGFPAGAPTAIQFAKTREKYVWAEMDVMNLPPEVKGVVKQVALVLKSVIPLKHDIVSGALFITERICHIITQAADADPRVSVKAGSIRVCRIPSDGTASDGDNISSGSGGNTGFATRATAAVAEPSSVPQQQASASAYNGMVTHELEAGGDYDRLANS